MNKSAISLITISLLLAEWSGLSYAENADRNKPIHLESDRVFIDDVKQTSEFEGQVRLTQGTLTILATKIVVTQDAQGFKHCTATGHLASFRQKREGKDEFLEGYGERIEYDTRADNVDFFVQARIKRAQDDVQGDHIAYNTKTEIFQVVGKTQLYANSPTGGRVRAVLQPKSKDLPLASPSNNDSLSIQSSSTLSDGKP